MEWKGVVGFETRYRVSDGGVVWSINSDKPLKPGRTSKGYFSVLLYDGSSPKKPKSELVHRIVCQAFLGEQPSGHEVNHKDGDKANNALANLEYVTGKANCIHAVKMGLTIVPKQYLKNRKLSREQVLSIRQQSVPYVRGTIARLAREHGVTEKVIADVIAGRSYQEFQ